MGEFKIEVAESRTDLGHPKMSFEEMSVFFKNSPWNFLPVIENGRVLGTVKRSQFETLKDFCQNIEITAFELMIKKPVIVRLGTPFKDVITKMAAGSECCVYVVDEKGELLSLFSMGDALKVLSVVLRTSPDICRDMVGIENYAQTVLNR